jgi:4-hydroxybenzoate polyprenyltransferase
MAIDHAQRISAASPQFNPKRHQNTMTPTNPALATAYHTLRAMRPNHWTKNLVVLAAFVFALGDRTQPDSSLPFALVAFAFVLFCLVSSGIYLFNDIRDIAADRQHPLKRFRPLASGAISTPLAGMLSIILLAVGLLGAFLISKPLGGIIAAYVAMQIAYTLWLKHVALVDVFVIAGGFVLRAAAGGVVINVTLSPWLLICAFLLALFLALCKRRHEKCLTETSGDYRPSLDNYDAKLLDQLIAVVSAATIVSYSIYTLWPDTTRKFGTPLLSLSIPFVIFGIFRYLDLVYRKEAGGRPEKVLLDDIPLLIDLLAYALTILGVFVFAR